MKEIEIPYESQVTRGDVSWYALRAMVKQSLLGKALRRPQSLRFHEARKLAEDFGFVLSRVSGSHHVFVHPGVPELINLQDVKGMAKAYQVRQLLRLVERYDLRMEKEP